MQNLSKTGYERSVENRCQNVFFSRFPTSARSLIKLLSKHSLILLVYLLLVSDLVVAMPGGKKGQIVQQPEAISQDASITKVQQLFKEGVQLSEQRTIPSQLKAIEKWKETLSLWRGIGDKSQEALTLVKLGSAYKDLGTTTLALKRYNEALVLYRELGNPIQEAFTLSQIGDVYVADLANQRETESFHISHDNFSQNHLLTEQESRNKDQALQFYNQALKIYQESGNRQEEASILNNLGQLYALENELGSEEAFEFYNQALKIYQEIGESPNGHSLSSRQGEALVLSNLSKWIIVSNDQEVWDFFNQSLVIYQELGKDTNSDRFILRQREADLLNIGAVKYWWSRNRQKALEFHNQALTIYQEIGYHLGEASTLKTIGDRYLFLEDKQKALEFYNQSLSIYQSIGDRVREASILNDIGFTYSALEDRSKALEFFHRELETFKEISQFYSQLGDPAKALEFDNRQPSLLMTIGKLYYLLGNQEKELDAYNQARRIYQEQGDYQGEVDLLISIADIYIKLEDQERTVEFCNDALTVYRKTDDLSGEANLLSNRIAPLYLYALKDHEKGLEALNQALRIYQEIGDHSKEASTLEKIGRFYTKTLENPEKALEFHHQATPIYQELEDLSNEVYNLRTISKLYYELGNKDQALEIFNQAGRVYQGKGEPEKEASTWNKIGKDYTELGDKATALEFYRQAIPIYQDLGDYQKEAITLRTIGQTYTTLGNLEKALESYHQALTLYNQELNASRREIRTLDILVSMGQLYSYLGEEEKALELCNQSLTTAQEFVNRVVETDNFIKIGKLCYQIGDHQKALASFNQYKTFYQKFGSDQKVNALIRIGEDYAELGDYQKALDFFNQARQAYQESGFREGEINTLSKIGGIYSRIKDPQKALNFYNQALTLAQEIGDLNREAIILADLGTVYAELEDGAKALELYNQSLTIYQELGNRRAETNLLNKIGTLYEQLRKPEKALEFYHQSLTINQESSYSGQEYTFRVIGKLYYQLKNTEKALEFLNQSLIIAQESGESSSWRSRSHTYNYIGKVYSDLGDWSKALESFNKSLVFTNDSEGQAENLFGIAIIERNLGNLDTALTKIEAAISLIEKERANKSSQQERQVFFASKQDYYEFYIDLLMTLHQQEPLKGYNAQALQVNEHSRARSLLELLTEANTDIRRGVDPELVIQERSLQQQLDAIEQRRVKLFSGEYTLEQKVAIEQEQKYLLQKYEEVRGKIREKSPSYAALTQPQPLNFKEIQQQILDQDTVLLQYSLGKERSYLWAVTKDNLTSYQLPPAAEIEDAVRQFRDIILRPIYHKTPQRLATEAHQLSNLLLKPIANKLNKKRLLIIGDGALQYLPFSALSIPSTNSSTTEYQPLVSQYEIVNLPSVSTLAILRQELKQRQEIAPKQIAIFADPIFSRTDERVTKKQTSSTDNQTDITWGEHSAIRSAQISGINLAPLPGTRQEAQGIMSLVPQSQRTQVFDFAANREFATSSQLSEYRIIHFATHGILNSEQPELSGIVLSLVDEEGNSQNGFLRLHDIFNLHLPGELVVLSACQTGLGKQVRGEGLVGLTRGFMYAGMPRVLASLWSVDDQATSEFMTRFYRLMLGDKLSVAEALREAQIEMQEETKWKAPYYWAAFTLQGEWD